MTCGGRRRRGCRVFTVFIPWRERRSGPGFPALRWIWGRRRSHSTGLTPPRSSGNAALFCPEGQGSPDLELQGGRRSHCPGGREYPSSLLSAFLWIQRGLAELTDSIGEFFDHRFRVFRFPNDLSYTRDQYLRRTTSTSYALTEADKGIPPGWTPWKGCLTGLRRKAALRFRMKLWCI